jgi:hypothetical protein
MRSGFNFKETLGIPHKKVYQILGTMFVTSYFLASLSFVLSIFFLLIGSTDPFNMYSVALYVINTLYFILHYRWYRAEREKGDSVVSYTFLLSFSGAILYLLLMTDFSLVLDLFNSISFCTEEAKTPRGFKTLNEAWAKTPDVDKLRLSTATKKGVLAGMTTFLAAGLNPGVAMASVVFYGTFAELGFAHEVDLAATAEKRQHEINVAKLFGKFKP